MTTMQDRARAAKAAWEAAETAKRNAQGRVVGAHSRCLELEDEAKQAHESGGMTPELADDLKARYSVAMKALEVAKAERSECVETCNAAYKRSLQV